MNTAQTPIYDAGGNVIDDGANQYLYDAEGRLCAVSGVGGMVGYVYDAEGNRIAKRTITSWICDPTANGFLQTAGYVVGPAGEQLTEIGYGGGWLHTNVWAAGKLIATFDNHGADNGLHFHLDDPLGTRRAQTDGFGTLEAQYASLPYGDGLETATGDPTENHFTAKERDAESGNDYMFARYYNSATGRFLSPDWSAKEDPVPYAKLDNPQSLNLYSYVYNNPLGRADADGHCPECVWEDLQELEASPAGQKVVNAVGSAITAGLVAASGVGSKVMDSLTGRGSASYAGNGYELAFDIMYSGKSSPVAPAPAPSSPSNSASPSGPEGPYKNSPENTDRMKQGKAPIGNDGKPVELHHEGQKADGDVTEMTQTDHPGGENFKKNHSNTGQEPSQIDRNASGKARREHWKDKTSDPQ